MDNKTARLVRTGYRRIDLGAFLYSVPAGRRRYARGRRQRRPGAQTSRDSDELEKSFGFVCAAHNTYQNIQRDGQFAVSYMRPDQTVLASLAASPRCEDGSKPITQALPTTNGPTRSNAPLVEGGYLFLECELDQIVDELGENSLIIGRIVGARFRGCVARVQRSGRRRPVCRHRYWPTCIPDVSAKLIARLKLPFPAGFKRADSNERPTKSTGPFAPEQVPMTELAEGPGADGNAVDR